MKEVQILAWCDSCASDERREPATVSVTVAIGQRGKPLTIDLCDTCHEATILPVTALLDEYGQAETAPVDKPVAAPPSPKTSSARERSTCPICSKTRSASWVLANHIWRDHLGEERPPAPTVCPDCGYDAPESARPTAAVGRHRANVHGYDPLVEPLERYQRQVGSLQRKPA